MRSYGSIRTAPPESRDRSLGRRRARDSTPSSCRPGRPIGLASRVGPRSAEGHPEPARVSSSSPHRRNGRPSTAQCPTPRRRPSRTRNLRAVRSRRGPRGNRGSPELPTRVRSPAASTRGRPCSPPGRSQLAGFRWLGPSTTSGIAPPHRRRSVSTDRNPPRTRAGRRPERGRASTTQSRPCCSRRRSGSVSRRRESRRGRHTTSCTPSRSSGPPDTRWKSCPRGARATSQGLASSTSGRLETSRTRLARCRRRRPRSTTSCRYLRRGSPLGLPLPRSPTRSQVRAPGPGG